MENKFATDKKSLVLMAAGVVVLFIGYILLAGGGVKLGEVFNYEMFNFRRMVLAPIVILAGIVIEVVAIMKVGK